MGKRRPIVIDCNSGIDNIYAAKLLMDNPNFDVKCLCVCHGNSSLDNAAGIMAGVFADDTELYAGSAKGLVHSMPRAWQINGIEKPAAAEGRPACFRAEPAWEAVYKYAVESEGELELFIAGPFTDLATAVLKYPNITELVKCIWYLGGAVKGGNITPSADYNIWQDPHSAEIVFEAGFKRIIMLDSSIIKDESIDISGIVADMIDLADADISAIEQNTFKDYKKTMASAVLAVLMKDHASFDAEEMYVLCETQSSSNYGQLVIDWNGRFAHRPNAEIITRIDAEKLIACLNSFREPDEAEEPEITEAVPEVPTEPEIPAEPETPEFVPAPDMHEEDTVAEEAPEEEDADEEYGLYDENIIQQEADEELLEDDMSDLLKELTAEFDSPEEGFEEIPETAEDAKAEEDPAEIPEEPEVADDAEPNVNDSIEHALNMIRNELKNSTLTFDVQEQELKQEMATETQEYSIYANEEPEAEPVVAEEPVEEVHHTIEREDPDEFIAKILKEQNENDEYGSLLDDIPEVLKYAEETAASSETVFFDLRKYDEDNGPQGNQ